MLKFIKLAWRNMWRNWRRTLIATVAIILSMFLLIFFQAFMDGMDQSIYGNTVRLYGGNVLIHAPGYREKSTRLPMLPVADVDAILAEVRSQPNVIAASRRINTGGLISNRSASHAVNITAIEPETEAPISLAAENIVAGRFLQPDDGDNIVIGQALADYLNVSIGDRVSLLGRRKDESMRQRSMTVVGIFDLGLGEAEKGLVFINLPTTQTLYNLRGEVTEVAVILEKIGEEDALIDVIAPEFPNHEVDSIYTLRPEFAQALEFDRVFGLMLGGILLLMGAVGILNLMLMAVFERTREMGVLAALGLKGNQIMGLFVLEGALIGLIGAVVGCVLSWAFVAWLGRVGIDFSMVYSDLGEAGELYALMGTQLYPAISNTAIIIYGLAAVLIGGLAALYPAWQAAQREPAESLHYV
ncbi:MAG: ABC transporter permease [Ardenticatenaceae bacterium]|nr:ABC transporter permease [Ardenticatenaceae bacterium]MCB9443783.1 ABC transporter permease [Ardenticatenaceae bacterium]